jgi:hypothetical protein
MAAQYPRQDSNWSFGSRAEGAKYRRSAGDRSRTDYLRVFNAALYQLGYPSPVGLRGFEPP